MNKKKKEYFRTMLAGWLNELVEENNNNSNGVTEGNERIPDPSDRATVESERTFTLRIKERERGLIGKIKEALQRIQDGTYGICEACQEEISEERLEARPVTTLCIECKKRQEVEERIRGL